MSEQEMNQMEITIAQAKEMVAARDAALKLKTNREFKKVILEGYFREEAVRLTSMLADPGAANFQDAIIADLRAISGLQVYLHNLMLQGDTAERSIAENESELETMRGEENEG